MASFSNYHEMFTALPDIDAAAIITPSGMHLEHATDIMARYGKHVIMEKPTFMRPDELVQAYDVANGQGVKIFPVFQNRYNKAETAASRGRPSGACENPKPRVCFCGPIVLVSSQSSCGVHVCKSATNNIENNPPRTHSAL